MRESTFQTRFLKWLMNQEDFETFAFELKITKTKSLSFNALLEHQKISLLNTKHRRLAHKIADDSVGFKPYDGFFFKKEPAFVVIQFYKRGEKRFYMIDIDDWVTEPTISDRKSITEERAADIGWTCLLNKKNGCTRQPVGRRKGREA